MYDREENGPFDVLEDFPETGDLSTQTGGDVIDKAQKVRFRIENVEPRVNKKDGVVDTAKLNVRVSIGALGVDGEGKYKGKNLFLELLTYANPETRTSEWWQKQARFPYKTFLKALGFDEKNPPKVTDAYITSLKGREFIADITRPEIREKGEDGKYVGTGEFKNELKNLKAIEE